MSFCLVLNFDGSRCLLPGTSFQWWANIRVLFIGNGPPTFLEKPGIQPSPIGAENNPVTPFAQRKTTQCGRVLLKKTDRTCFGLYTTCADGSWRVHFWSHL